MQDLIRKHQSGTSKRFETCSIGPGYYNSGAISSGEFNGPVIPIKDEEQFVPLFSAFPLYQKKPFLDGSISRQYIWQPGHFISCFYSPTFPKTYALKSSIHEFILIEVLGRLTYAWSGLTRSQATMYEALKNFLANTPRITSIPSFIQGQGLRQVVQVRTDLILAAIKDFKANKKGWKRYIRNLLVESLKQASVNKEQAYGLPQGGGMLSTLSTASREAMIAQTYSKLSTLQTLVLTEPWIRWALIQKGDTEVNGYPRIATCTPAMVRYGFLSEVGFKPKIGNCAIPNRIVTLAESNNKSFGRPEVSPWYGVKPLACIVVKAKHRDYISAMVMCMMEDRIALPKDDLQLWVSPTLPEVMHSPNSPEEVAKTLFDATKENLTVVVKDNLGEALFGPMPSVPMVKVEEYKQKILSKAKIIADESKKDPYKFLETLHSL